MRYVMDLTKALGTKAYRFVLEKGITPVGGLTEKKYRVSLVGGKRVYTKEAISTRAPKLPEAPWRYFTKTKGKGKHELKAFLAPVSQLKPIRAREGGIERAANFMRAAYDTGRGKREPISVMDNGNGTYAVLSGNSTYANAVANGWKKIPVVKDEKLSAAVTGIQSLIKAGRIPGDINEHISGTKAALKLHNQSLAKLLSTLRDTVGDKAKIKARVKKLDSALGKVVRKAEETTGAPKYKYATDLQDLTGTRIVLGTVAEVYDAVAKLKTKYEVVVEDDYVTTPRPPMNYRSVHLIIRDEDGLEKEVQVRTHGMDVVADFTHDLFKPVNETQRKMVKEKNSELNEWAAQLNDHVFSKERGEKPARPSDPGCPAYLKRVFGCPPL